MWKELKKVFITDCIESRGYTKKEAKRQWKEHGNDFVENMIEDMWTNWSENFPVKVKGE